MPCYNEEKTEGMPVQPTLSQTLFHRSFLTRRDKLAFFSTFGLGMLVHLYAFTRQLMAATDAYANFISENDVTTSGRWLLGLASSLSPDLTVPWLLGVLALLMLSCAAVPIVRGLDIRHTGFVVLTALLLVSYPALMATYRYLYTADAYMIAVLLSVLAFYVTDRYRFGFAGGMALLACSLGIYQAYLPLCIGLMTIRALTLLLRGESAAKELVWKALRYVATVAGGLLLYWIITKLALRLTGQTMTAYQGLDQMGRLSVGELGERIVECYRQGWRLLRSFGGWLDFPLLLLTGLECGYLLLTRGPRPKAQIVAVVVLLAASPVLFGTVYLMGAAVVYRHMQYSYVAAYLLPIALMEEILSRPLPAQRLRKGLLRAACVALVVLLAITGGQYAVYDNYEYAEYELITIRTYAQCLDVKQKVESCEGYAFGMPVMIDVQQFTTFMVENSQYQIFMKHFVHTNWPAPTGEQWERVQANPAYATLTSYPEPGCVKVIDGVAVLRMDFPGLAD